MHIHVTEQDFSCVLYHLSSYSLQTRSLTEPGARLAVRKPQHTHRSSSRCWVFTRYQRYRLHLPFLHSTSSDTLSCLPKSLAQNGTESHIFTRPQTLCVTKNYLEFLILLPPVLEYWNYNNTTTSSWFATTSHLCKTRALCMLPTDIYPHVLYQKWLI